MGIVNAVRVAGVSAGSGQHVKIDRVLVRFTAAVGPRNEFEKSRSGQRCDSNVKPGASSTGTEEVNASSKPATFMTISRLNLKNPNDGGSDRFNGLL